MRKKTEEIRLSIDFRNLNKVYLKDNYPLPKVDHILQRVVGASHLSLLDGYSSYNQVLVREDDQDKTIFTTPWGTFKYVKMPFGLKNARATFQCAMEIAFSDEKYVFLVVYLDDVTVFSHSDDEHLHHLRFIFRKCRNFGISFNPNKSLFVMEEAVKEVPVQNDPEGRRGRWIASLLEYGLEIKPTKLIKGQGLAKIMAESNLHALDINLVAALSDNQE
eukprot:PITA_32562